MLQQDNSVDLGQGIVVHYNPQKLFLLLFSQSPLFCTCAFDSSAKHSASVFVEFKCFGFKLCLQFVRPALTSPSDLQYTCSLSQDCILNPFFSVSVPPSKSSVKILAGIKATASPQQDPIWTMLLASQQTVGIEDTYFNDDFAWFLFP